MIVTGTLLAAVAVAVIVVAPSLWLVGAAMLLVRRRRSASATTTIYAVAGSSLPPDAHATGFGIMTTASLMGLAVSPVVAGFIGGIGIADGVRRRRGVAGDRRSADLVLRLQSRNPWNIWNPWNPWNPSP